VFEYACYSSTLRHDEQYEPTNYDQDWKIIGKKLTLLGWNSRVVMLRGNGALPGSTAN